MSLTVLNPEHGRQVVIIGRFHGRELTSAQAKVLTLSSELFPDFPPVVLLGCSRNRTTKRNPLPYEARAHVIRAIAPKAIIGPIFDQENNDTWSENVDAMVTMMTTGKPILVGGRDSFLPFYEGKYEKRELALPEEKGVSATIERRACGQVLVDDPLWRQGVIWATENQFDRVDSTVDAFVISHDGKSVLVGWKSKFPRPNTGVFPGGYINKNERAEDAVKRELFEETTLSIEGNSATLLGTAVVADWRYQRETDRSILTHMFVVDGGFIGGLTPSDDIDKLEWVPYKNLRDTLATHHLELFEQFKVKIDRYIS